MKSFLITICLITCLNISYSQKGNQSDYWGSFPIEKEIRPFGYNSGFYISDFQVTNDKKFLIVSVRSSVRSIGLLLRKEKFMVFEYGTWKHLYTTPELDKHVFKTYSLDSIILCTSARLLADKKVYQIYPYSKQAYHDRYRYGFTDDVKQAYESESDYSRAIDRTLTLDDYYFACNSFGGILKIHNLNPKLNSENEESEVDNEKSTPVPKLITGEYFGLIIGVNDYKDNINELKEPINDANLLYSILTKDYTFKKENLSLLNNPDKATIIAELDKLANKCTEDDNVLIFFAGHGYWDEQFNQGYWLPVDAKREMRGTWISNSIIRDYVNGIPAKHTLLITDACFGGGIFKTRAAFSGNFNAIEELYEIPSKKAMTSGAMEEVPDKSIFLKYLARNLKINDNKYLTSEDLFAKFKNAVINNSPNSQIPQFGVIQNTGDEGGDFIFIKK